MSKDPSHDFFTISEDERAALRAGDEGGSEPQPVRVIDKRGRENAGSVGLTPPESAPEVERGNTPSVEQTPQSEPSPPVSPDMMEVIDLLKPGERLWIRDVLYEVKGIVPEVGPILQPVALGRATLKALKRNERRNQSL